MFRVAKKMMGNQDGVSDIVQDVFIDFYNRLTGGNEIRHPQSWLYRVTCNKCIDSLRKQKKFERMEVVGDAFIEPETGNSEDIKEAMNLALGKLSPREKILAVLYSEGLSYREIAEATGIKPASVGKLLSRTLLKIEKEFKDHGYELY
jgi:RNA polymerase sigma-70 factor (ECF subfamily)